MKRWRFLAPALGTLILAACGSEPADRSASTDGVVEQSATDPFALTIEFEGLVAWVETSTEGGDPVLYALLPNASYARWAAPETGFPETKLIPLERHPPHWAMLHVPEYVSDKELVAEQFIPLRGVDVRISTVGPDTKSLSLSADPSVQFAAFQGQETDYGRVRASLVGDSVPENEAVDFKLSARVALFEGSVTGSADDKPEGHTGFGWGTRTACPNPDTKLVETVVADLGEKTSVTIELRSITEPDHVVRIDLPRPDAGSLRLGIWNKVGAGLWFPSDDDDAQGDTHYETFRFFYKLSELGMPTNPRHPCNLQEGGDRCPQPLMDPPES